MKSSTFGMLALAAAAKLVSAHTTVHAVWINDVDQGEGNSESGYIRSPPSNSPITDVTSKDMTCNVNNKATAKTLEVKAGDKITFEWHHDSRSESDDIIASSHNGPILVYMAPTEKGTAGNGWVKIAEDGYTDGTWAVETLIKNRGKHSVTVPDVAAGEYLFRPEIIALHEGNREGGAQFYMECVQVKVTSSGSKTLPEGVSIPGAYTATDKGILFNIYDSFDSYPIPGPAVWDGASGSSSSPSSSASASAPAPTSAAPAPSSFTTIAKQPATTSSTEAPSTENTPSETTSTTSAIVSTTAIASTTAPATPSSTSAIASSAAPTNSVPQPSSNAGGAVKEWYQCGGLNYKGSNQCEEGLICQKWNPYYHQCISA
ncbi:putative endo-beta-1,4-glucanase D [Aspergillus caelatus]|uniref:AA9 family lytic polysaccharide monooxygenase n=1 Tax=Aspergillus caelatus TaxID=61420 RepID=A0A5N7AIN0_9EURO|nr:putative endo-beta-1,4-glucanase D [Aspergillus caelatus]KAE8369734.1 putative endo-beta-1,4-glucanase D [Aspergillus caelatus]